MCFNKILDGQGYYYKCETLKELKNKIFDDNEETLVYKGLIIE